MPSGILSAILTAISSLTDDTTQEPEAWNDRAAVGGLKKMRHRSGATPTFACENCKCNRYSPCTCMKGHKKPN